MQRATIAASHAFLPASVSPTAAPRLASTAQAGLRSPRRVNDIAARSSSLADSSLRRTAQLGSVRHLRSFSTRSSALRHGSAPGQSSSSHPLGNGSTGAASSGGSSKPSSSSSSGGNGAAGSTAGSTGPHGSARSPPRRAGLIDLALLGAAGASISAWLFYQGNEASSSDSMGKPSTFTIAYESAGGGSSRKTLELLDAAQVDSKLRMNEKSYSVQRRDNPVFRYDTNALASNAVIEDDSCFALLSRANQPRPWRRRSSSGSQNGAGDVTPPVDAGAEDDLMFFGVFDGHSGWHTSRYLSEHCVRFVARELDAVFKGAPQYRALASRSPSDSDMPAATADEATGGKLDPMWRLLGYSNSAASSKHDLGADVNVVQQALKTAFCKLDDEIVLAPLKELRNHSPGVKSLLSSAVAAATPASSDKSDSPPQPPQTEQLSRLLPALSGSCALLAYLDTRARMLHIACTGDSRAVMGTYDPSASGGKWRVDVLSEDQTGRNPNEVERMRTEHPPSEIDTVIQRGRVLGGLEPTRAFGDARYKWPVGTTTKLAEAFNFTSIRSPPRNFHTPPYVTARPEVVSVDVSRPVSDTASVSSPLPAITTSSEPIATRFVVLATDGLYDRLSSEEVVALVGAHLNGLRGSQTRSSVMSKTLLPNLSDSQHATHRPAAGKEDAQWTFEDRNISTMLIRNALGGAKGEQVSALLSIPAPMSRRYRDDITVTVVLLGDAEHSLQGGSGGVARRDQDIQPLKAKL